MKIPLEDYYSKNVFLDLAPYFGDALLGCVTDAGGYGRDPDSLLQILSFCQHDSQHTGEGVTRAGRVAGENSVGTLFKNTLFSDKNRALIAPCAKNLTAVIHIELTAEIHKLFWVLKRPSE